MIESSDLQIPVDESTTKINPLNKEDMSELIKRHKEHKFFDIATVSSEDITRRDIVEFAYYTRIASMIQEAQQVLKADHKDISDLREKLGDVLLESQTKPGGGELTPRQTEFTQTAISTIVDSIQSFNKFLEGATPEDIRRKLGPHFSHPSADIDTTSFPGVVVVQVRDPESYYQATSTKTKGLYSPTFGEEELAGHVIVINANKANEDIENHEYLHFLYHQIKPITPLPNKEAKASKAKDATETPYRKLIENLKNQEIDLLEQKTSEMAKTGQSKLATRQELGKVRDRIRTTEDEQALMAGTAYAEILSYEDPQILNTFEKFKDEYFAYSTSGTDAPQLFWTYIGGQGARDKLMETSQGRAFIWELNLIKQTLQEAYDRGYTADELAYYVVGSRSLVQAAKFVYLHMQEIPAKRR